MPTQPTQVIIGTAGHIDHGKTALVKALTGVDADTLAEEKRRGITIELGFVFMPPAAGRSPREEDPNQIVFIDVPGHERLIKTMVAGAANLDAVMLVIAADEGVAAQTREHFEILQLLGVQRGLVALTKVDLVDQEWLAQVTGEVRAYLAGSFLQDAPILPLSAHTGEGIEALRGALEGLASQTEARADSGVFRMPIDRVFTMQGFGTVVAGTVLSGQIAVGEQVTIYPEGLTSRVRGVQIHGAKTARSESGQRTALNLSDLDKDQLRRGQTAAALGSLTPTHHLDAQLMLLPGAGELKHRSRLRLHLGTDEIIARLTLLDRETLLAGETATVQLALEAPAVAVARDRFVVRTFSPLRTIGGGVILDANPKRHKRFDETALQGLTALVGDLPTVAAQQLLKAGATPQHLTALAGALGRGEAEVGQALETLLARQEVAKIGDRFLHRQSLDALREGLLGLFAAYYERNPRRLWMPLSDLQTQFAKLAGKPVYEALQAQLENEGTLVRAGTRVRPSEREIPLTEQERQWVQWLEGEYRTSRFRPPTEEALAERLRVASTVLSGLLTVLREQGRLVRVEPKVLLHVEALREAREVVRREITQRGSLTVAQLRDTLGISRKIALALMEYFDAVGLTRREGETRVLV